MLSVLMCGYGKAGLNTKLKLLLSLLLLFQGLLIRCYNNLLSHSFICGCYRHT